jgi:hypothetical protein
MDPAAFIQYLKHERLIMDVSFLSDTIQRSLLKYSPRSTCIVRSLVNHASDVTHQPAVSASAILVYILCLFDSQNDHIVDCRSMIIS